jgi:hypothetical protein
VVRGFGQVGEGEARRELAADLFRERVAALDRPGAVRALPLGGGQIKGGERERVAHYELNPAGPFDVSG